MMSLHLGEIDTSVGFAFLIKDEIAFEKFVRKFKAACSKRESFLCMEGLAPEIGETEFESVDEDEFEQLAK